MISNYNSANMRRLRPFLINTLLAVTAVAMTLIAAILADKWLDLGVRGAIAMLFESNIQEAEAIMYVYDSRVGWRLNPYTQYHRAREGPFHRLAGLEPFDVRLRTNSEGFVDREHDLSTGHYRIAMLGNSYVEAVQQDYTNRFAPLTEDYVFSQSDGKKTVEIMNFGVSNAAPAQAYGIIKHFVLKYKPNEVWLFVAGRDVAANSPIDTPPPFGPTFEYTDDKRSALSDIRFGYVDPPAYTNWKRRQELGKYLSAFRSFGQITPYFYSGERNFVFDRVWDDMRLTVSLIKRTLDRAGVRMRVVYVPAPYEADAKRWAIYRRESSKIIGHEVSVDPVRGEQRYRDLAKDLDIEFLSLLPLCKEKGADEMYFDHFSRMGHHWVADYLARVIVATAPASAR